MEASPPAAHLWTKRLSGQLRSWLPESRVRHLLIAQNVINIFRAEFPDREGAPFGVAMRMEWVADTPKTEN